MLKPMYQNQIQEIKKRTLAKLQEVNRENLEVTLKKDQSLVTEMDLYISDLVKEIFSQSHPHLHFFSEEDQQSFQFPMIILDPIDGTKEFARGVPECAISLAIMNTPEINHHQNFAWIFNPFTGFEISTTDETNPAQSKNLLECTTGLVSRTEWSKGLFNEGPFKNFELIPRGSIAFKLGLLAGGACDFVLSRQPKNIWDLAAGTLIAYSRELAFWEKGKLVKSLDRIKFKNRLLWAHPAHFSQLEEKTKGKIWN